MVYKLFSFTTDDLQLVSVWYDSDTDTVEAKDNQGNPLDAGYQEHPYVGQTLVNSGWGASFLGIPTYPYAERNDYPPEGAFIRTQCYGYDLYNVVADGQGGEKQGDLVEVNSTSCGFSAPLLCIVSKPFTIEASREPRYIMEFDTMAGQVCRVEWQESGYTGEPEYICGGTEPVSIEWQGLGNKTDVISGSGAAFELHIANDDILKNLYTVDERKYRVSIFIDNVLEWQGYHLTDIYSTPWLAHPFIASVQAYDGLASLSNKKYVDSTGARYYGRSRAIDVIFRCLRLLDLDLPVWLGVNVWEDTTDLNVEPLSQVYVDQSVYYNEENEPLSCKDVLEYILKPYNAFVKQSKGAFHILRYNEVQGVYNRRKAIIGRTDADVQIDVASEVFEDVQDVLVYTGTSYREGTQHLESKPGLKQTTSITEYGAYENFVFNGDFELWQAGLPVRWIVDAEIERYSDKGKFSLGFKKLNASGGIYSNAYAYAVKSNTGFTFKFDYLIEIDDFARDAASLNAFTVQPDYTLSNGAFNITPPDFGAVVTAIFNGSQVTYGTGTIKTGITGAGANNRRTDAVVALSNGTFQYLTGQTTAYNQDAVIPTLPLNSLLVTYLTFENEEVTFCSVNPNTAITFGCNIVLGDYSVVQGRSRRNRGYVWSSGVNELRVAATEPKIEEGYAIFEGTIEVTVPPLSIAGVPSLTIKNPFINRNEHAFIKCSVDNVYFGETAGSVERMLITGENTGHFNTPPLEVELHHGSGIPRTEALLTLADGTAAQHFNNGNLLQELTARDILAQHTRASLVLNATLTAGAVNPISLLRDPHLPEARFLIDKFIYLVKASHVEVSAIEVFGGPEDAQANQMLFEDGSIMFMEDNTQMRYE